MRTCPILLKIISITLVLAFVSGQACAGVSNPVNNKLGPSLALDGDINPKRSESIQNDISKKAQPGAIGNGAPLRELAQGKLPARVTFPAEVSNEMNQKLSEAIKLAIEVSIANKSKVPQEYLSRLEDALKNLVTLGNALSTHAYLFKADVRGEEDYLLGFNYKGYRGIAAELIRPLYKASPRQLAQYLFHECFPEKGVVTERDDHRSVYEQVQSAIFGESEVKALKKNLRKLIDWRLSQAAQKPQSTGQVAPVEKPVLVEKSVHGISSQPDTREWKVIKEKVEGFAHEIRNVVRTDCIPDVDFKDNNAYLTKPAKIDIEVSKFKPEIDHEGRRVHEPLQDRKGLELALIAHPPKDARVIGNYHTVHSTSLLPDGRIVSAGSDGKEYEGRQVIRLWDIKTGVITLLKSHENDIDLTGVLPDGRLVSADSKGLIKIWDLKNNTVITIKAHDGRVEALSVLLDGSFISAGDHTIKTWDLKNNRVTVFYDNKRYGCGMAVLPDGKIAYSASAGKMGIWDQKNDEIIMWEAHVVRAKGYTYTPYSIAGFSDERIVSCAGDGTIKIWDLKTDKVKILQDLHEEISLGKLLVLPDGTLVSAGGCDSDIKICDLQNNRALTLHGTTLEGEAHTISLLPGRRIIVGGFVMASVWQIPQLPAKPKLATLTAHVQSKNVTIEQITKDLPVRAKVFAINLSQILAKYPDKLFFMGIETDIGESQKAQMMPLYKAIDRIENMTDASGNRLFPNLMVRRKKASELVEIVTDLNKENKLELNNVFIGARNLSVEKTSVYDAIKGEGKAWISAIEDSRPGDYLPLFEAITLSMMAYMKADLAAMKNFYDAIADSPVDAKVLEDMIKNQLIYILPKATAFNTEDLRHLYEAAYQAYIAA